MEVVKEEATYRNIVDVSKYLEWHEINEDKSNVEEILSWVKSTRMFERGKKKVSKIKKIYFTCIVNGFQPKKISCVFSLCSTIQISD